MNEATLLIPNGEWNEDLKTSLKVVGLSIREISKRNYSLEIPELELPAQLVRTRDIPVLVDRMGSSTGTSIAGFTGSDILITTNRRRLDQPITDWVVPLTTKQESKPRSEVYLAYTPNAVREFGEKPTLEQILEGVHRHFISRIG